MQNILNDFVQVQHLPFQNLAGFSGSCFHIHPNYDPQHQHHGVVLLQEASDGAKQFTGLFSFFAPENPYSKMDLKQLKAFFDQRKSKKHPLVQNQSFDSVQIDNQGTSFYYWLKTTPQKALLLAQMFYQDPRVDVRIFCELQNAHQ